MENFIFVQCIWKLYTVNRNKRTRRPLAGFDTLIAVLVNGKLFAFVKVRINFTIFSDGMSPFFKIFGKSFVMVKFATDVFAKTTSSTVAEIIKLVIITRPQICIIAVTIYIRYRCFGNICDKEEVCSNSCR